MPAPTIDILLACHNWHDHSAIILIDRRCYEYFLPSNAELSTVIELFNHSPGKGLAYAKKCALRTEKLT